MTTELKPPAAYMLDWLAKEDDSAFGECQGDDFTNLLALGLVEFVHPPLKGETLSGYERVRLSEHGRTMRALLRAHKLVDFMFAYVGRMAPGDYSDFYGDANDHFLYMSRNRLVTPKKKDDGKA